MGKSSKDKRDIYYRLAKEQGWRARSAFKLLQIQETFDIFHEVKRVVDLCAAPGSWSQVLSKQVYEPRKEDPSVKIVAVDLQLMSPLEGVIQLQGDITETSTAKKIISFFDGELADLVVSDGAPDVIGLLDRDEYVQHQLVIAALEITTRIIKPGGTMVAKVFRGKKISALSSCLSMFFDTVTIAKPRCSRDSSLEAFVVCQKYQAPSNFSSDSALSEFLNLKLPPCPLSSVRSVPVSFVVCGAEDAFDSDRTYPLNLAESNGDYQHRDPVQPPIRPPYEKAQKMRKDKTLARLGPNQNSEKCSVHTAPL